ncbi:hypothetical protein L596_011933 [Steinernema carpocapsae]|uniref:Uncharacterized protein n=1 Tax=Steinernema carpocapsae TaxID=34508 RepID=A0A4U5NVS6_STECR|nr:hypothetical protein L596_011933 [Steinernema carpocapsae]
MFFNSNVTVEPCDQTNDCLRDEPEHCLFSDNIAANVTGLQGLSPKTNKIAEKILDERSSQLHKLHKEHLRTSYYAARLFHLHEIQSNVDDVLQPRKEKIISTLDEASSELHDLYKKHFRILKYALRLTPSVFQRGCLYSALKAKFFQD